MVAVSLFWDTNVADLTSCENTLLRRRRLAPLTEGLTGLVGNKKQWNLSTKQKSYHVGLATVENARPPTQINLCLPTKIPRDVQFLLGQLETLLNPGEILNEDMIVAEVIAIYLGTSNDLSWGGGRVEEELGGLQFFLDGIWGALKCQKMILGGGGGVFKFLLSSIPTE